MEEYIPKSALVAEIEKRQKEEVFYDEDGSFASWADQNHYSTLESLKNYVNTFKAKEADLDEEIRKEIDKYYDECEKKLYKMKDDDTDMSFLQLDSFAKHFFELGMQAQFDKELVEEIYSHLDSIKDTANRMTSGNFMHNIAAIKFSANTIAKVLELMGLKAQKGE
jgi:replicative superfamily II helicase